MATNIVTVSELLKKPTRALVPGTNTGLLSRPHKMPCKSFSLPAKKSCPRANGTICDSCYAFDRGMYQFDNVKLAQMARFDWTIESMRTPEGRDNWVRVMVAAIGKRAKYFRVHDSGDMFNAHYAECWYRVCAALPGCKFWIPSRTWQQPSGVLPVFDPVMNWLRKLAALPNVTVRPSALNFGDNPPVVPGLHAGSTSENTNVFTCVARMHGNKCGPCRRCWESKQESVSYPKH